MAPQIYTTFPDGGPGCRCCFQRQRSPGPDGTGREPSPLQEARGVETWLSVECNTG